MPGVCRVGDIGTGICPNHKIPMPYTTVFISGDPEVTTDGLPTCVAGVTIGTSTCGHPTIALSGSEQATANGHGLHRVGDVGANFGPYTAISGSEDVTSE